MNQLYLFVDFEFTMPEEDTKRKGFIPEIIEAGVVAVGDKEVQDTFSSYVKPELNPVLNERCMRFLEISQEAVDQGISFYELVQIFEDFERRGDITVVTWGNMDMHVLRNQCMLRDITYPFKKKEIDLSLEHKRFYGEKNQSGLMKALLEYGRAANGKHHKALDDARNTFEIFKLMEKDKEYLQRAEPSKIGELVDLAGLLEKLA